MPIGRRDDPQRLALRMASDEEGRSSDGTDDLTDDELEPVSAAPIAGGGCLVFDPSGALTLRAQHRLPGRLIGTVPASAKPGRKKQKLLKAAAAEGGEAGAAAVGQPAAAAADNVFQKSSSRSGAGLPLFLSAEETALAVTQGLVTLTPSPSSSSADTPPHRQPPGLLLDLWRRRFYVTAATKFGGEWLCYRDDPLTVHADYIVSHWPCTPWPAGDERSSRAIQAALQAQAGAIAAMESIGVGVRTDNMTPDPTRAVFSQLHLADSEKMIDFAFKTRNFASKTRNFVSQTRMFFLNL